MTDDRDETGDPTMVALALTLAGRGVPILPVGPDKRPIGASWKERQAVAPAVEVVRRELRNPAATGYGIVLGFLAGRALGGGYLFAVDLEAATDFSRLVAATGLRPTDAPVSATGGGGRHLLLRSAVVIGNLRIEDQTGRHVGDVKGEGGYIVGPGSLHASGRRYAWLHSPPPPPLYEDGLAWLRPLCEALGWRGRRAAGGGAEHAAGGR